MSHMKQTLCEFLQVEGAAVTWDVTYSINALSADE